jgi:hypothetical protein
MLVAPMAAMSFVPIVMGGVGVARLRKSLLIPAQDTFGGRVFFDPVGLMRGMACGPCVIQRVPFLA